MSYVDQNKITAKSEMFSNRDFESILGCQKTRLLQCEANVTNQEFLQTFAHVHSHAVISIANTFNTKVILIFHAMHFDENN